MILRRRKVMIGLVLVICFAVLSAYYLSNSKEQLYGNDKNSILKVIHSIDGYENKSIEILDIYDFHDSRGVGFLSDNTPAYIQFARNSNGNYEWQHIETARDPFGMFVLNNLKDKAQAWMVVTSHHNQVANMQVRINGELIEQTFTPNHADVTYIEFPPSEDQSYTFRDYKFYGEDGKLLDE